MRRLFGLVSIACAIGCGAPGLASRATPAAAAHAARPQGAPGEPLEIWHDLDAATFARAKKERKYIVLDGSAEWCHWCHVMEATTYHDPRVVAILEKHFIAVKVDVDSRPDIQERYGDWGWPATVIFSPDADELGKYRGYIPPEKFIELLSEVVARSAAASASGGREPEEEEEAAPETPLDEEHLAWVQRFTEIELMEYYDAREGGWGTGQKAPLGGTNAWALMRARKGDRAMRERILFTLDKQSALIDPVWGGIYQYSAASTWDEPHFEKLMTFQAGALDNYAEAYELTRDPKMLHRARTMYAYIDGFLKGPEGGFYATQDADLNAHDRAGPFMNGHDYYAMNDAGRRAAGMPRVDKHEYGRENGLAIGAYCTYHRATGDGAALATAERAADRILATHATERGGISHDVASIDQPARVLYLADNAAFGWALMRLHEIDGRPERLAQARRVADFMLRELADARGGGFFAHTEDDWAAGVFKTRRRPHEDNVMALRFFARLARATKDTRYVRAIDRTLRFCSRPEEIKGRGRMIGDFLLALEETRDVRGK
jgi:hypothetical protein